GGKGSTGDRGPAGETGSDGKPGKPPASFSFTDQLGVTYTCTPDGPAGPGDQPHYSCTPQEGP
ncbi:MAG: hypothetical protein ACRDO8_12860, partial [Nocardioidaceae bacterium]